ncbi:hypothetical protein IDG86_04810 [Pelagibacterales bacterium SAG-MED13]|nr:hypothetical protein [Pelagibacterales bacterium SAG-MED13]
MNNKNIFFLFIIIFISSTILFNKKIIEIYFLHKLSNWVEKDVIIKDFQIKYPDLISIKNLEVKSSNSVYYDLIFEAKNITVKLDLNSFLSGDLRIINNLTIEEPKFYLEVVQKNSKLDTESESNDQIVYEDNIGIAQKINQNFPDKVWPVKKKDINFLILKSRISNGISYVKISPILKESEILLSDFEFTSTGNLKGHQHYKDVLKIMLFDIFSRETNIKKKRILKTIYKF